MNTNKSIERNKIREKKKQHHMQHNEKILVMNVIKFFDEEKLSSRPSIPFAYSVKRAATATGVSESTIKRLKRLLDSGAAKQGTSLNPKRRLRAKKILMDDTKICTIRSKIAEFYLHKKEVPSLKKLLVALKKEIQYEGGREHLRKLLLDIGFNFKKCADRRQIMLERSDTIAARSRYLRRLRCNDELGDLKKPVIYLDETYIGPSLTVSKNRQIRDCSVTEEYRWVIVHVAKCHAFIPENALIYSSLSKAGESHNGTAVENLTNWIQEKILPSVPQPSIIVVVNSPYYQEGSQNFPPASATKQILQDWLTATGIKFEQDLRNAELYEMIQQHKPKTKHVVDDIFQSRGHEVLYLPPFHGNLNPIEHLWTVLKTKLGVIDRTAFKSVDNIAQMAKEAFQTITAEDWFKELWKVKNLEWHYWSIDSKLEEHVSGLGITEDCDDGACSEEEVCSTKKSSKE